jgi:hypothetical protein
MLEIDFQGLFVARSENGSLSTGDLQFFILAKQAAK